MVAKSLLKVGGISSPASFEVKDTDGVGGLFIDGVAFTGGSGPDLTGLTSSVAELNIMDGVTATTAEINKLAGNLATAADLTKLHAITADAAELNTMDGVTAIKEEINNLAGLPVSMTVTLSAGGANTVLALFELKDKDAQLVVGSTGFTFDVWVSDAATGAGLTAVTPSGALAVSTFGALLTTVTASKHLLVTTTGTARARVSLIDTAKTQNLYFCAQNPVTGKTVVSAATITANYG